MKGSSFNRIKIRKGNRIKDRKQERRERRELDHKRKIVEACGCPDCSEVLNVVADVSTWIAEADRKIADARKEG